MTPPDNQLTEVAIVRFSPTRVATVLMAIAAIFALVAIALAFLEIDASDGLRGQALDSLHRLFNPDIEANLATWFATALLLSGALLTGLVARVKIDAHDPTRHYWVGLSGVALFMSIDEAAQFHEMLQEPTRELLGVSS